MNFLLVLFAIISVILIILVLLQNDEKNGMMSGGNSASFGSHSGSILKKTTGVFIALFFILVFASAFSSKGNTDAFVQENTETEAPAEETAESESVTEAPATESAN